MRSAILAGGASRRFGGEPKGLAVVGGERIVDRVSLLLEEVTGNRPSIIIGNEEQSTWFDAYDVLVDSVPGRGVLGGIYTALRAGPGPVLVAAWDMPFLESALLRRLCADSPQFDAFLPASSNRRGVEPLCAVYDQGCSRPIREQLDSGDLKAVGFHPAVRVGILPHGEVREFGDPDRMFFNVNTNDDLKLAEEMWLKPG